MSILQEEVGSPMLLQTLAKTEELEKRIKVLEKENAKLKDQVKKSNVLSEEEAKMIKERWISDGATISKSKRLTE